jgi:2-polyprenyl-6-methoxyphenol hydroxylase-like FAD-dependent oxidoreductase
MSTQPMQADIVVAGGGPVGLYLAGLLGSLKYNVILLEKKTGIDLHSKSLGIHPVSLELFDEAGIAAHFLENGIQIQRGIACLDIKKIGEIDFSAGPRPFNFILAIPQYRTEQILEKWVKKSGNVQFIRGAELNEIHQSGSSVTLSYTHNNSKHTIRTKYLAGCDGKNSIVRQAAGIKFNGKNYPDTYIMGDFEDNTGFGSAAVVYLHRDGLIESFPLPDSNRRWVVKNEIYFERPTRELLEAYILDRLDHNLNRLKNSMISSFGVQHFLAEKFYSGRIALAGDSAHVVSPIGGQGMNLGWLTAQRLADAFKICLENPSEAGKALSMFNSTCRKTAKKVARRAELNMWLGRKRRIPYMRNLLVRLMVQTPLRKKMARTFMMRDL